MHSAGRDLLEAEARGEESTPSECCNQTSLHQLQLKPLRKADAFQDCAQLWARLNCCDISACGVDPPFTYFWSRFQSPQARRHHAVWTSIHQRPIGASPNRPHCCSRCLASWLGPMPLWHSCGDSNCWSAASTAAMRTQQTLVLQVLSIPPSRARCPRCCGS